MLGVIGVLASIALVIYLAFKGWSIIPASLLCSLVVILTNKADIWTSISGSYADGFKYFIGAFFLSELDTALEKLGLFNVSSMDDILVLAPTRWKLRKAVKVVHQVLASLGLQKHPDKTFIGRIEKGFSFLSLSLQPRWPDGRQGNHQAIRCTIASAL